MLNEPLPSQIDVRKLATKGAEITGNFSPEVLPRFVGLLANTEGSVVAKLSFYIDESRKRRIDGDIKAEVKATCQRCLKPVDVTVNSHFELAIVWSDDDAQRLPKTLEPLIVGEELINLADVVEEELILSFPFVNYHNDDNCKEQSGLTFSGSEKPVIEKAPKENPFKVLEQLKSGK